MMTVFRHRNGRTVTAEPGTKRHQIFQRSRTWTEVRGKATAQTEPAGLEVPTVAVLQEQAEALGLTGYKSLNKSDLIEAIETANAEE